jgi:heme O synthase-like polyprenyltransferase
MNPAHVITVLFGMAVLFGVGTMVLKNSGAANALVGSSVGAISTVVKANEGRA